MSAPDWLLALPRPELMAIGDSFLNGMRAYTIHDAHAAQSIPALLARSLAPTPGLSRFQPARYPDAILIDVEAELRRVSPFPPKTGLLQLLGRLDAIKRGVVRNARAWLHRFASEPPPETPPAFDNLAISGAVVEDVFDATYGHVEDRIAAMTGPILHVDDPLDWHGAFPPDDPLRPPANRWGVGDVHIALNARHLMNPANLPGLRGMRVIDMVRARRPRTLIVNIGPNHGLIDITLRGDGAGGLDRLRRFVRDWPLRAAELATLPDVEVVVILLMPLPSLVPNMMPLNRSDEGILEEAPPAGGRYFPLYVPAIDLPLSDAGYDAAEMERIDTTIEREVRVPMRDAAAEAFAGSGKTLRFVDLTAVIGAHDAKHRRGPPLRVTDARGVRSYTNYATGDKGLFSPTRLRGGLCSLDNHHPSGLGYAVVAEAVRRELPAGFASERVPVTDCDDAFLRDPPWPGIGVFDALHRRPPGFAGPEAAIEAAAPVARRDLDRLVLRAAWMR